MKTVMLSAGVCCWRTVLRVIKRFNSGASVRVCVTYYASGRYAELLITVYRYRFTRTAHNTTVAFLVTHARHADTNAHINLNATRSRTNKECAIFCTQTCAACANISFFLLRDHFCTPHKRERCGGARKKHRAQGAVRNLL